MKSKCPIIDFVTESNARQILEDDNQTVSKRVNSMQLSRISAALVHFLFDLKSSQFKRDNIYVSYVGKYISEVDVSREENTTSCGEFLKTLPTISTFPSYFFSQRFGQWFHQFVLFSTFSIPCRIQKQMSFSIYYCCIVHGHKTRINLNFFYKPRIEKI